MPSKGTRVAKKQLKRVIINQPEIVTNDTNLTQAIEHTSIRLDKGNSKVYEEELIRFDCTKHEGVKVKIKKYQYESLKQLKQDNKFDIQDVETKLYNMKNIWDKCYDLHFASDKKLKAAILDEQKRIEFLNDALLRKKEADINIKNGEDGINKLCLKWCNIPQDCTVKKMAGVRKQINAIIEFLYIASAGRVDLTTPNIRELGTLNLTTKNRLKFYLSIEDQIEILKDIASNDNKRKLDFKTGEFKTVDA